MRTVMEVEGSGFVAMVEAGQVGDLARMYALFKRAPGGLDLLRLTMGAHIRATGRALVQARPPPARSHGPAAGTASCLPPARRAGRRLSPPCPQQCSGA